MTKLLILAEGGGQPTGGGNSPLIPATYDVVWSFVAFIIIAVLFTKFVLPKFKAVLDERAELIEGGMKRAEAAQEEAKAALKKYNDQLAEARAEANQIREDARTQGQKIIAEAKAQAAEESSRIMAAGEKQLEAQRDAVVSQLRKDMGQDSVNLAEKILGSHLSDEAKRAETIDSFLSSLDDMSSARK